MAFRALGQTGMRQSEFSFGCAGIAGLYQDCPEDQATATLTAAWTAGIRSFDTAPFYGTGLSEQRLGRFLADKPRDGFVISTKAGRLLIPVRSGTAPEYGFVGGLPARVVFDYSGPGIRRSVGESLARLGLTRIDILYLHDIGQATHGSAQAARHMGDLVASGFAELEVLKAEGVIGAWGLGVNEVAVCLEVMAQRRPDVILLAGRYTLLDRSAQVQLLPLCRVMGVPLVIGGVLNSGILATGAVPGARFDYALATPDICQRVTAMQAICQAGGVSLLSAALRFALADPVVASILLGNSDPVGLAQNLAAGQVVVDPQVFADCGRFAL